MLGTASGFLFTKDEGIVRAPIRMAEAVVVGACDESLELALPLNVTKATAKRKQEDASASTDDLLVELR